MTAAQITRDLVIPLADGTRLSADLYRPQAQPAGPATAGPVLVSYYPYRKDDVIGSLFERTRIRLCERGYASVFADMAGTGASGGDYGESFDLPREGRDFAEVIDWVARQDWCDGNVGAWGVSYGGMNALAAAACRPAHLRAIVAVYASADLYQDTIAPGGCLAMLARYAWGAHMAALGLCPPTLQDPDGQWRRTWRQRLRRLADGRPHALNWQAHTDRDAYWRQRAVDATAIEVPALLIGGWADAYKDSMTSLFHQVRGRRRLVMGPWMHVLPHLSDVEPYDWVSAMADWWDEFLRQPPAPPTAAEAVAEDRVLFFVNGQGWRRASQWPPPQARQQELFLAGYRLEPAPPPEADGRDYQGDPTVGVSAGIFDPFGTGNGWPEEQSGDDARSLTFTSEPLPEPLLLTGQPEAVLYLDHLSETETNLAARLSMVGPDGRSTLIAAGSRRCPPGPAQPHTPTPGTPITVALSAAAFWLPAGARLRLSVACADFPRLWPTPENPAIRVRFGGASPSVLRLPACDEASRRDEPASVPRPPAEPDTGWATGGEPLYRVSHDKAAGEVAVTFGASSQLRAPSGARLTMDEQFTARVSAGRPDGAALLATIGITVQMSAGERVEVAVRSASSRTATTLEGSVVLDGATVLRKTWTSLEDPKAQGT